MVQAGISSKVADTLSSNFTASEAEPDETSNLGTTYLGDANVAAPPDSTAGNNRGASNFGITMAHSTFESVDAFRGVRSLAS